ncbi:MAG: phosphoglucosamine mutase [Bacillota bacterium]
MALFGTDGVRGVANRDLSPELAFKIGRAGAFVLVRETGARAIAVGRDTRISGDMLEAAVNAGILSTGVDVWRLGVLPTPAVAHLTRELGAGAGLVISASHNPVEDNGIKFFGADGYKLPDALEEMIERLVLDEGADIPRPTGTGVGKVREVPCAAERYLAHARRAGPVTLGGIKIVVDCANGAACTVAPSILSALGAQVVAINHVPDGTNINVACGSTNPAALRKRVLDEGADLGLAFDGDADRVIAVDEQGNIVNGDRIMVVCARYLKERGRLPGDTVVVTVMSNLGLHIALREAGIRVLQTRVGDRYVLEAMLASGARLGGEQSGHIIFLDHNTTGDGLITALQLLHVMMDTGKPLSELATQMQEFPQVLENVRVTDKEKVMASSILAAAVAACEARLDGQGRVLVRPSGTEPFIRVMVEGRDEEELLQVVNQLVEAVVEADRG